MFDSYSRYSVYLTSFRALLVAHIRRDALMSPTRCLHGHNECGWAVFQPDSPLNVYKSASRPVAVAVDEDVLASSATWPMSTSRKHSRSLLRRAATFTMSIRLISSMTHIGVILDAPQFHRRPTLNFVRHDSMRSRREQVCCSKTFVFKTPPRTILPRLAPSSKTKLVPTLITHRKRCPISHDSARRSTTTTTSTTRSPTSRSRSDCTPSTTTCSCSATWTRP